VTIQLELTAEDERRLRERAGALGETPVALAQRILRSALVNGLDKPSVDHEGWVSMVSNLGLECGVSPPGEALSSEALYE